VLLSACDPAVAALAQADEVASSPWISTIVDVLYVMDVDGDLAAWA